WGSVLRQQSSLVRTRTAKRETYSSMNLLLIPLRRGSSGGMHESIFPRSADARAKWYISGAKSGQLDNRPKVQQLKARMQTILRQHQRRQDAAEAAWQREIDRQVAKKSSGGVLR